MVAIVFGGGRVSGGVIERRKMEGDKIIIKEVNHTVERE
jgi:hypothetical protein